MGEIADLGSRALHDTPIVPDKGVHLGRKRRDLGREFPFQPFGPTVADASERLPDRA